ncbi:putative extracellular protein [Streptococcus pneumoniae]|nr:putative extracellular protein [Streptococcus pneumoniae]
MKIMLLNIHERSTIILSRGKKFIRFLTCFKGDKMENLLDVIEQFLSLSDEKLEELADKNQLLRLQEEKERKNA